MKQIHSPLGDSSEHVVPTTYNYKKKPYRALCLQYRDGNAEEVLSMLSQNNAEGHLYGEHIMVRYNMHRINTIGYGDWVVVGEDGRVRFHGEDVFKIKYEEIT